MLVVVKLTRDLKKALASIFLKIKSFWLANILSGSLKQQGDVYIPLFMLIFLMMSIRNQRNYNLQS